MHSTSFVLLIHSPGLSLYQIKCSVILLLNHTFPILVPILILKDLLHHIIRACQSLSNLFYSCCTSMLPKNPAKISCSPLIFCIPLLTYLWANVNMAIWLGSALLYWHQAASLLEISFLRCPSDLVVAQEQLKIIALKVGCRTWTYLRRGRCIATECSFYLKSECV